MSIEAFIKKWEKTGASERANFQPFMIELMALLDLEPVTGSTADKSGDDYAFERPVKSRLTGTTKFMDFYRRNSFVMEGKQGSDKAAKPKDILQYELDTGEHFPKDIRVGTARRGTAAWVTEMIKARQQAENYARSLESDQGLPPFIIVVDVGYVIELYADFSGQGKYEQFPNKKDHQIYLEDLKSKKVQERLKAIWNDPQSLDSSKYSAKVTREVAERLAKLGMSFPIDEYAPETVAKFLMRCLFTMFAEDVDLIPKKSFENLLKECRGKPETVAPLLEDLWKTMDAGGFSVALRADLKRFNGGLFRAEISGGFRALPINTIQLGLLIDAAEKDWQYVEPSIFGTLLERALSPKDRHKLGAHYTPRPYVERLVGPTIMEPLRADFDAVSAAAIAKLEKKDPDGARTLVKNFHHKLCTIKVLDPACGSGNFLYVTMERMKRLEADVLKLLEDLGEKEPRLLLQGETIDPHQFLGLEINEWAVWAAELVLWIGYLQWHFKTFQNAAPSEPVLKDFHNIEKRDALLTWESTELRRDEDGEVVTRWDGESFINSNVTGEDIPDPDARTEVYNYNSPKMTKWPEADFIIGNPPFLGSKKMRDDLGDGYVDALLTTYNKLTGDVNFVMYWWHKAAVLLNSRNNPLVRFGFITTDTIKQVYNRKVIELAKASGKVSICFAIKDHPWIDASNGASVRIAMTVLKKGGSQEGRLEIIKREINDRKKEHIDIEVETNTGVIYSNLQSGINITRAKKLLSNDGLSFQGVKLVGGGFQISPEIKKHLVTSGDISEVRLPEYWNCTDIHKTRKKRAVIDFTNLDKDDINLHPKSLQIILDNVKKFRDDNNDDGFREKWWLFGRPRYAMRSALKKLDRFIATGEVTKHRAFIFLSTKDNLVDGGCYSFALEGADFLAILSSRVHVNWVLKSGGDLGVTPRYNNTVCFDPFPFPDLTANLKLQTRLAELGERLDKHRKDRQAEHPKLTLTQMYNVLEKTRSGEDIEGKDKQIYDNGLIGTLKQIHDDIDKATARAYGWPDDLSDEEILTRLVALNRERALEEAKGKIRWLRPEYQNPDGQTGKAKTTEMDLDEPTIVGAAPWPKALPEQMGLVRAALTSMGQASVEDIRSQFKRAQTKTIKERLDTLAALGQAEVLEDGRYAA